MFLDSLINLLKINGIIPLTCPNYKEEVKLTISYFNTCNW